MAEALKFPFKATRCTIEQALGTGYVVRGVHEGDGTQKDPWKDDTATASNFEEAVQIVKDWLNAPEGK